jgi:hypothetical protein
MRASVAVLTVGCLLVVSSPALGQYVPTNNRNRGRNPVAMPPSPFGGMPGQVIAVGPSKPTQVLPQVMPQPLALQQASLAANNAATGNLGMHAFTFGPRINPFLASLYGPNLFGATWLGFPTFSASSLSFSAFSPLAANAYLQTGGNLGAGLNQPFGVNPFNPITRNSQLNPLAGHLGLFGAITPPLGVGVNLLNGNNGLNGLGGVNALGGGF